MLPDSVILHARTNSTLNESSRKVLCGIFSVKQFTQKSWIIHPKPTVKALSLTLMSTKRDLDVTHNINTENEQSKSELHVNGGVAVSWP